MKARRLYNSPRTQLGKAKMLRHLKLNLGNVRRSAQTSGVKKSTFYDWCRKDGEFKKAVLNIYRGCEDFAIENILTLIAENPEQLLKVKRRNAKRLHFSNKQSTVISA